MLKRCYSKGHQKKQPTYIWCAVCADWLTFSVFKKWMENQEWQGSELDKDLLFAGNKIYSPETCVFVSKITNLFTVDRAAARGDWPIGVHFDAVRGLFVAQCKNPFGTGRVFLGRFSCPNDAHEAWRRRKHELALQLAALQKDDRVAANLRLRYA